MSTCVTPTLRQTTTASHNVCSEIFFSECNHDLYPSSSKKLNIFHLLIFQHKCLHAEGVLFIKTLRPRQNGPHFADDIFKRIFLNENVWISRKISLEFIPRVGINNILALIQIMDWHRPGGKQLSEPMMDSLLTHICVTRHQWVKRCWQ